MTDPIQTSPLWPYLPDDRQPPYGRGPVSIGLEELHREAEARFAACEAKRDEAERAGEAISAFLKGVAGRPIGWPVDAHAARQAAGQRHAAEGHQAVTAGPANGLRELKRLTPQLASDAPNGRITMEEWDRHTADIAHASINRRQLVKRLRARFGRA